MLRRIEMLRDGKPYRLAVNDQNLFRCSACESDKHPKVQHFNSFLIFAARSSMQINDDQLVIIMDSVLHRTHRKLRSEA